MGNYRQGIFVPKNPDKYIGNVNNIIYRSGWELKLLSYVDAHPQVKKYSSEELAIPYLSPLDQKIHRYYPDLLVQLIDGRTILIEVKPDKETRRPVKTPRKKRKTMIYETATHLVNQAKWKAAREFCAKKQWEFKIFTEHELGISSNTKVNL